MKLRQARKILRRGRVRHGTLMAAILRLEKRATRWIKYAIDAREPDEYNRRPTYTLRDLFRLADMEPGGWNDGAANKYVRMYGRTR